MKKRIEYEKLIKRARKNLNKINEYAKSFCEYEMTKNVAIEMERVLKLSHITPTSNRKFTNIQAQKLFGDILHQLYVIDECLGKVELLTSNIIKRINELPKEERNRLYYFMGIPPIKKEDQGISRERGALLYIMQSLSSAIISRAYIFIPKNNNFWKKISKEPSNYPYPSQ